MNMWKRAAAIGMTFGMLIASMPVQAFETESEERVTLSEDFMEENNFEEESDEELVIEDNDQGESADNTDESLDDVVDEIPDGLLEDGVLEAAEEAGLLIDEEHFPDPVFRQMVMEECDTDSDGVLSQDEISQVESLDIYGPEDEDEEQMNSLEGIEYFVELRSLKISGVNSTIVNVSNLPELTYLECCYNNELQTVNASGCISLTELEFYSNAELRTVNASGCISLRRLHCYDYAGDAGKIQNISLDGCTALEYVDCYGNSLETIDVSSCANLETLICSRNQLTSLDISNNPNLKRLYCHENQLTDLNVWNNSELTELGCNNNQLTTLNVTNNSLLKELYCSSNKISGLEISSNTPLRILSCSHNNINNLDLSSFMALEKLWCGANPLQGLNVSSNSNLTYLHCFDSGLTELDVSNNPCLKELYCDHNNLENLSIQNCPYLQEVYTNGRHSNDDGVEKYEEYYYAEYGYEDRGLYFDSPVTIISSVEQMYTITWDFNGGADSDGNVAPYSSSGAYGWKIIQPIIEKEGYVLDGWSTEQDGEIVLDVGETGVSSWTVVGDATLYAVWSIDDDYEDDFYTVIWDFNGGVLDGQTQYVEELEYYELAQGPMSHPEKEGFVLKGWSDEYNEVNLTVNEAWRVTESITFYAIWAESDAVESGVCDDGLSWELHEDGTLFIEGSGPMKDYSDEDASPFTSIDQVRLSTKRIHISEGITSIGDNAFSTCFYLQQVQLPASLTKIGSGAFKDCGLTSIIIPDAVTEIGSYAFHQCSSLAEIQFPASLQRIGIDAFYYCTSLTSIVLPDGVTSIGATAFEDCTSLSSVILPESLPRIEFVNGPSPCIFKDCPLLKTAGPIGGDYNIQYGWKTTIPGGILSDSSLEEVVIGDTIQTIDEKCFYNCPELCKISIPSSVQAVGSDAFYDCAFSSAGPIGSGCDIEYGWTDVIPDNAFPLSVTSVILPKDLKKIFKETLPGFVSYVRILGSETIVEEGGLDHIYLNSAGPIGSSCNIEFAWTTEIPDRAFENCNELTQVVLPDGISRIGCFAFSYTSIASVVIPDGAAEIADRAFSDCRELTNIIIPESVKTLDCAFQFSEKLKTAGPIGGDYNIQFGWKESIPQGAFFDSPISNVMIPDGIKSIGPEAFSGSEVTDVVLPDTVTEIGGKAFSYCEKLCSVVIPSEDTIMENGVFDESINLKTAGGIGSGCNIQFGWEKIPCYAFASGMSSGSSTLEEIIIPEGTIAIGRNAFDGCDELSKLIIPSSVSDIGYSLSESDYYSIFGNCKKLETAGPIGSGCNIEYGWTTSIPDYAFAGHDYLKRLTICDGISYIGYEALNNCSNLEYVYIPDTVQHFENRSSQSIYNGCTKLKTAGPIGSGCNIEYGWTMSIPDSAFYYFSGLTSVTIPNSVTTIWNDAFLNCTNLQDVYYSGTESQWNQIAICSGNDCLTNATIHFNSSGGGYEEESDIKWTPVTFGVTYPADGDNWTPMQIEWGFDLFDMNPIGSPFVSGYDNRLAIASAVLSEAAYSEALASKVFNELGINDLFRTYNYDDHFVNEQPVCMGYTQALVGGEMKNIYVIAIRGTMDTADFGTDAVSWLNKFQPSAEHIMQWFDLFLATVKRDYPSSEDLENVVLVTGHSLGGSVAGMVTQLLSGKSEFPWSNTFCYTFAAAKWADKYVSNYYRNIYNIVNNDDVVPNQNISAAYRNGIDIIFKPMETSGFDTRFSVVTKGRNYESMASWDFLSTGGNAWDATMVRHQPDAYMAYLLCRSEEEISEYQIGKVKVRRLSVRCPVDVEIVDKYNNVVAKVENDEIKNISLRVETVVEGDEKFFYLLDQEEYFVKLIGNDKGNMTLSFEFINAETKEITLVKEFENVALEKGKMMKTSVNKDYSPEETRLLVLNNQGIPVAEVSEDGNEISVSEPSQIVSEKITISKKPSIKKPTAAKSNITVKWSHFKHTSKKMKPLWKKIKKVQVQCATDSGFTNIVKTATVGKSKTKAKIKGLQKNTVYYVRVRYYDGTGYSNWSGVKKIKTKK